MRDFPLPRRARLAKAHGCGNSFVVATDADDSHDPSAEEVRALCSQAFGIGADGFIRCVRSGGAWFMDYRNADGSKAEMCGNGVRVFVDHLRREGLVRLAPGESLDVLTRGGTRTVALVAEAGGGAVGECAEGCGVANGAAGGGAEDGPAERGAVGDCAEDGGAAGCGAAEDGAPDSAAHGCAAEDGAQYRVDMGPASSPARETVKVSVPGIPGVLGGIWVDMPNPHTVVAVDSLAALEGAQLPAVDAARVAPQMRPAYEPEPRERTNLELVVDLTREGDEVGHLRMRVLERGVGETMACGTGCCAAAVATALRRGPGAPASWPTWPGAGCASISTESSTGTGPGSPGPPCSSQGPPRAWPKSSFRKAVAPTGVPSRQGQRGWSRSPTRAILHAPPGAVAGGPGRAMRCSA